MMKDINEASCIAKWIAQQRNPHGGFANTQVGKMSLVWDATKNKNGRQHQKKDVTIMKVAANFMQCSQLSV